MPEDWQKGGFGLYVHWPYCTSKCPYCDFNSHVAGNIDQHIWAGAYTDALALYALETPGRVLNSIYFGGGTPSLMHPELVETIIDAARSHWAFSNTIEITLEANPGSVEARRFAAYRLAGINRVSLGIQALNDHDLRRLGRTHTAKEALTALDIARNNFDRTSFDLIYARQDQSLPDWEAELTRALDLQPEHLSLYQLTIEPETVFGARARAGKLPGLPGEDLASDMFELTSFLCENNGLPLYEVSNHAVSGKESVHNMIYWQAGDYIGIGPGAHGRLTLAGRRFATETPLQPEAWLKNIAAGENGEATRQLLGAPDQGVEYLLMGLRTKVGVSLTRLEMIGNTRLDGDRVRRLMDMGLIQISGDNLRVTRQGLPVLNAILRELVP